MTPFRAREAGEIAYGFGSAWSGEIGIIGDIGGRDAFERGCPGFGIFPIEGGAGAARADAHGNTLRGQTFGDTAAGFAGAANDQNGEFRGAEGGHFNLLLDPVLKLYCGGHLTRFSALPVLTYFTYAALRFSKTTSYVSPQRLSKRALKHE